MPNPIKQKFIKHMELYRLIKKKMSPEHLTNDHVRDYFRHLLLEKKRVNNSLCLRSKAVVIDSDV